MRSIVRGIRWLFTLLLVLPVRFYQAVLRPMLPPACKFDPNCSEYFIQAVKKHGPLRGTLKGAWRICRCNPWNPGGHDPP